MTIQNPSAGPAQLRKARAAATIAVGLLVFVTTVLLGGPLAERRAAAATSTTVPAPKAELDVVVLLDTSNNMLGGPLSTAEDVATSYIKSLPAEVQVGIVTYGQFPTSMYRLSTNRAGSVGAVGTLTAEGNPAVYDGLEFAADQFDLGTNAKRQIVLIGSGDEQGSAATLEATVGLLRQRSIRVDSIIVDAPGVESAAADAVSASTGGGRVLWSDKTASADLLKRTVQWSTPVVLVAVPAADSPSGVSSIFTSKIVLGIGVLLIFVGLTFVLMNVTGPRQKKVNLTGVTEVEKKAGATPMSGIAERLSEVADKALEKQGKNRGLSVSLERAGINLKPGEFLIVTFSVLLAVFAMLAWFKGVQVAAIITGIITVFGPRKWVARKATKRSGAFGDQLSDTLQLLSSSLRAGQGLMQAVDSVAREGDAPAADEFRRVVTEVRLGRDLIDSLRAMADRIHSEDFNWVIPAIEINREVGGDLAEVLDTVAGTIRDRADIRRQVKTLSAEGRLSAYVLLSLPILIAGFIQLANPSYLVELKTSPGYYLAGAAALMMIIGGVWLFKLCKIDF